MRRLERQKIRGHWGQSVRLSVVKTAEEQKRDHAKRQAREVMEEIASRGETITYGELVQRITAITYRMNGKPLAALLSDISRLTDAQHGVLLAAVVVYAKDGRPGPGFFRVAEDRGRDVDDEAKCHSSELAAVHAVYREE